MELIELSMKVVSAQMMTQLQENSSWKNDLLATLYNFVAKQRAIKLQYMRINFFPSPQTFNFFC